MTVYRYRFIGLNVADLGQQVPGAIVLGGIGPSVFVDVDAPVASLEDLTGYMVSLGYEFHSTSPVTTPEEESRGTPFNAGMNATLGDVLALDNTGSVIPAASSFVGSAWRCHGVSLQTILAGNPVQVATSGQVASVSFAAAPGAAQNGSPVFLSAVNGEGTLVPPVVAGSVRFIVGYLQGADGVTTTPQVLVQPQYISRTP